MKKQKQEKESVRKKENESESVRKREKERVTVCDVRSPHNLNESSVNPKSTSNQSSKPCTVLQYPSKKVLCALSVLSVLSVMTHLPNASVVCFECVECVDTLA